MDEEEGLGNKVEQVPLEDGADGAHQEDVRVEARGEGEAGEAHLWCRPALRAVAVVVVVVVAVVVVVVVVTDTVT